MILKSCFVYIHLYFFYIISVLTLFIIHNLLFKFDIQYKLFSKIYKIFLSLVAFVVLVYKKILCIIFPKKYEQFTFSTMLATYFVALNIFILSYLFLSKVILCASLIADYTICRQLSTKTIIYLAVFLSIYFSNFSAHKVIDFNVALLFMSRTKNKKILKKLNDKLNAKKSNKKKAEMYNEYNLLNCYLCFIFTFIAKAIDFKSDYQLFFDALFYSTTIMTLIYTNKQKSNQ